MDVEQIKANGICETPVGTVQVRKSLDGHVSVDLEVAIEAVTTGEQSSLTRSLRIIRIEIFTLIFMTLNNLILLTKTI